MNPIVIIGTGLAGYTLAREFRKRDAETPLHMITADLGESYSKPMLSNALEKGKTPDTLVMATAEKMATDLKATIQTSTRVEKIRLEAHEVITDKGTVRFSKLVLALGAEPIRLPIEGDAANDVLSVNDLDDYRVFRDHIDAAKRVAIIGAGLIGCEFANDLSRTGISVDVIDLAPIPLGRLLHEQAGHALQQQLAALGVHWHLGTSVNRIDHAGTARKLTLANGEIIEADLVLSAVGLRSRTGLAAEAGLKIDRGIVVDRFLQTSHADVYALGDCAQVEDLVLPFVMPLMNSARALAATLAGEQTAVNYPPMPVVVKTSVYPVVVCPPPRPAEGEWEAELTEHGVRALFRDADGKLLGFSLTGDAVNEKMALSKELEPWL